MSLLLPIYNPYLVGKDDPRAALSNFIALWLVVVACLDASTYFGTEILQPFNLWYVDRVLHAID